MQPLAFYVKERTEDTLSGYLAVVHIEEQAATWGGAEDVLCFTLTAQRDTESEGTLFPFLPADGLITLRPSNDDGARGAHLVTDVPTPVSDSQYETLPEPLRVCTPGYSWITMLQFGKMAARPSAQTATVSSLLAFSVLWPAMR